MSRISRFSIVVAAVCLFLVSIALHGARAHHITAKWIDPGLMTQAPMNAARSVHMCAALPDGRVFSADRRFQLNDVRRGAAAAKLSTHQRYSRPLSEFNRRII